MGHQTYWEFILSFHLHVGKDPRTGKEGLAAIEELRALLEPGWVNEKSEHHPLRHVLSMASESHYSRLGTMARALRYASEVEGAGPILKRMGNPDEYFGAHAELDIATKLRLTGATVRFMTPSATGPTHDLTATLDGSSVDFEVTTLQPETDDELIRDFMGKLMPIMLVRRVAMGGTVSGIVGLRRPGLIELLDRLVDEGVQEAIASKTFAKKSLPGIMTIYFATKENAHTVPPGVLGSFTTTSRTPLPLIQKAALKVAKKASNAQLSGTRPGTLVIYDRMFSYDELNGLFEAGNDDIGITLETCRAFSSLVLVSNKGAPNGIAAGSRSRENMSMHLLTPPNSDRQTVLVWRNAFADNPAPPWIDRVFTDHDASFRRVLATPA